MSRFEVGKEYYCRAVGDSDHIKIITITGRSPKMLTYKDVSAEARLVKIIGIESGVECFVLRGDCILFATSVLTPLEEETAKTAFWVVNVDFPEWGTWRFYYQGQQLSKGYADIISHAGGSRVLLRSEYQHWRVVS